MLVPPSLSAALYSTTQIFTIQDKSGDLALRINLSNGCKVDRLFVSGRQVLSTQVGAGTGFQRKGRTWTSAQCTGAPRVNKTGGTLQITGLVYGQDDMRVKEDWIFTAHPSSITWKIERRYLNPGVIDSTSMPSFAFSDMNTWTGATLGTGGVAWCKLFDQPNATYGVQASSEIFWNRKSDGCLSLSTDSPAHSDCTRFTRDPNGCFTVVSSSAQYPIGYKHRQYRFLKTQQDIWEPISVSGSSETTVELSAKSYQKVFDRGDFKGLDTRAINEMINTIGRIGVIDEGLVGTNGWYSGYICLHEPWQARIGTTIDDPNYTRSEAKFLDFAADHAVQPNGMVKSRWYYDDGDAQPGTYDEKTGFYEAQWGRLMDSQSSYVWNVSDQFDQTGDLNWVKHQKSSCESALDYLLSTDSDGNGLVEMQNKSMQEHRSSDWLDIVWASHENAFVNAQLYGALIHWGEIEALLGDHSKAFHYRNFASRLKDQFNKPLKDGGFWDPEKGWYAYWREADGSVHGNNLTVEVNLTALADGICDEPLRRKRLLNEIERRMQLESLLVWPACFESFSPGEGKDDHFPTYENGDIFLSWAEYGVRAYAKSNPEIAVKYVKRLVDQYNKDGLAYQRYLRSNGQGAGDDILAGNCNVITGLYREIYGIQPKYNRLVLDPHLTTELNRTRVDYNFRGQALQFNLSVNDYQVKHDDVTITSSSCFGVSFSRNSTSIFSNDAANPSLLIESSNKSAIKIDWKSWNSHRKWTIVSNRTAPVTQTVFGIQPGKRVNVISAGKRLARLTATHPTFTTICRAGSSQTFTLQ